MRKALVLLVGLIAQHAVAGQNCVSVVSEAKVIKVEPVTNEVQLPSTSQVCNSSGCVTTLSQITTVSSITRYNVTYKLDGKIGKGYVNPEDGEPTVGMKVPVKKRVCADTNSFTAPGKPNRIQI